MKQYDAIIIGSGIYGLYSATYLAKKGKNVLVIECDQESFSRATYINQARVHLGYHYPRSYSTAHKTAIYFDQFVKDYDYCIKKDFKQIYATSKQYSWSDARQFQKFSEATNIPCLSESPDKYFKKDMCDGAFLTGEYTYDAHELRTGMLEELNKFNTVEIHYSEYITGIQKEEFYTILTDKDAYQTKFLLNASYASINQIIDMLQYDKVKIKYELCEIIICKVNDNLKEYGFTVMDGPFFSIMPFGNTGYHSLTSVTFTPHTTSYDDLPTFDCQKHTNGKCSPKHLDNCNTCPYKPKTAWKYMSALARKYLRDEYEFVYDHSLFSVKPILMASEIDDSRPTVIRAYSTNPTFVSVLSGKISTIYDLNTLLDEEFSI